MFLRKYRAHRRALTRHELRRQKTPLVMQVLGAAYQASTREGLTPPPLTTSYSRRAEDGRAAKDLERATIRNKDYV